MKADDHGNDGDSSWEDDGDDAGDASNIFDQQTT